jgi:hypothetical protein
MEVIDYKKQYKEASLCLLSEQRGGGYFTNKSQIWDWQYEQNPHINKNKPYPSIIFKENDTVIAFNGLMPVKVKYKQTFLDVIWSCDTIVGEAQRGKGFGGKLASSVVDICPMVLGLGISDLQDPIMLKRGYKVNKDITQFFFTQKIKKWKDLLKKTVQLSMKLRYFQPTFSSVKLTSQITDKLPEASEIELLWKNVQSSYDKTIIRNYDYLNWKYQNHPLAKYQFIQINNQGHLIALAIFRAGAKTSRLVDYLGPANAPAIKAKVLHAFVKKNSQSQQLECTTSDSEFHQQLKKIGFTPYKAKPRFYIQYADADAEKGWFIMSGDSDNDLGEFNSFNSKHCD